MTTDTKCALCGEPMPQGEEMFKYHGYSGPCPKPPLPTTKPVTIRGTAIELGALQSGGRGLVLQVEGELVTLDGLSQNDINDLYGSLEQVVEITIRRPNAALTGARTETK